MDINFKLFGKHINITSEQLEIDSKALHAYETQNYQEAVNLYSQLIEMSPEAHQYYQFRGTAYEDMGNDSLAKKDFEKAVELCPSNSTALYRLGMVYQRKGDLKNAILYLKQAYNHNPTYQDLMGNVYNNILFVHKRVIAANLGNFLTQVGDSAEGLQYIDEVINNCPDYSYPYYVKAITIANQGNLHEASKYALKAANLGNNQAAMLFMQIRQML